MRRDGYPLALALLTLVFFAPALRPGMVLLPTSFLAGFAPFQSRADDPSKHSQSTWDPLRWDALAQYYPWRAYAHRELRKGIIPLWNSYQFSGFPFVANLQSAVFYPPNLLFWLMDPGTAFGWSAALHAFLAGLGAFALLKQLGTRDQAAFIGGVACAFNGFSIAWMQLPTLMNSAAWMPWIFLAGLRACARPSGWTTIQLAIALALQLLAGHLQIAQLTWLALGVVVLFECVRARNARGLTALTCACLFALALASIQLLPTFELARLGHRTGGPTAEGYAAMIARAMKPAYFVQPANPWPQQEPINAELTGYVGLLILLVAIGVLASRHSLCAAAPWLTLAALGALVACGSPVCAPLYWFVPGIAQGGGFARATCILSVALAVLAGLGAEGVLAKLGKQHGRAWPLVPLVIAIEMCGFAWSVNWRGKPMEYVQNPSLKLIRKTVGNERVLFMNDKAWPFSPHPQGTIPPNGAMVLGLRDVQGYDSLQTAAYKQLMFESENGQQPAAVTNGNLLLVENVDSPVLDRLNVRFVVSYKALDSARLRLREQAHGLWLYDRAVTTPPDSDVGAPAQSVNRTLGKVSASSDSLAVTELAYFPGWRGWFGRTERAEIGRVETALLGVRSPGGMLQLVFAPGSFAFGAFVSLLAIALLVGSVTARRVGRSS